MSAPAMNSSNWRCHALAELGDVRGAVGGQERARAVRERGRGRQVGVQVLEPEPVEVGLQLGVGGEPTQSGCQEEKTSCVKPGAVSPSTVLIAPPSQSLRSSTQTRQPSFASSAHPRAS